METAECPTNEIVPDEGRDLPPETDVEDEPPTKTTPSALVDDDDPSIVEDEEAAGGSRLVGGFTHEAAESAVGAEGPLNKSNLLETAEIRAFVGGAEGAYNIGEMLPPPQPQPPQQPPAEMASVDSEDSMAEAMALPCDGAHRAKKRETFADRLRDLCQSPVTWRVVKGLIALAIAIKLYQSLDALERYVPLNTIALNGWKSLFGPR